MNAALARVLEGLAAGRPAALARAISMVENARPGVDTLLATLHPRVGRARRIGVTGPPGAGKSTLTMRLAAHYRAAGRTVAVVAVDPTSPFTGGALLGDRIRMESVALDPGVFIRSMATRGSLGGLAATTREVCDVLDAAGFERILVETVGVGQSEVDIARTADAALVVLVPESGDAIQTLKAGVMEIADVFVVNKADRPGADRLKHDLELMLGLRVGQALAHVPPHHGVARAVRGPQRQAPAAAVSDDAAAWTPPVLLATATRDEGIAALADALERCFGYLERSGRLAARRRERLRERVRDVVAARVRTRLWADPAVTATVEGELDALMAGRTTPYAVADAVLGLHGHLLREGGTG